jgi:prevent-host-death family protein
MENTKAAAMRTTAVPAGDPAAIEVGAYEAKTRLPELLRGVRAGKRYTISRRGQAIASLQPVDRSRNASAVAAADRMARRFSKAKPIRGLDLKALVNDGRA